MKRALVIAMLLGTRGASHADALGTLEGTVVNETGKVVTSGLSLTITCGSVRRSASLDGAGHFSVGGLPAGQCTITSGGGGFGPLSLSVEVTADSIATVLVTAVSRAYLDEVRKENEERARHPQPPMVAPTAAEPMPAHRAPAGRVHGVPPVKAAPPPPPPAPVIPERPVAMRQMHIRIANGEKQQAVDARVINGWAVARVFPVPHYTKPYDGPRSDFRETIYWNANVETNASGDADVSFVTSDAVTSFHATVEGFSARGTPGAGELDVKSKLPMSIDAHLPVEVTSGDVIRLPITVSNDTETSIVASLDASFGAAFKLADNPVTGPIQLAAGTKKTITFPLSVVATEGSADVHVTLASFGLKDELQKTIRVVPRGFPFERSASGIVRRGQPARHDIDLSRALAGSMHASVTMYPSPVAAMTKGLDGMIRQPGGCFEQASATNYPNIMILGYLGSTNTADPALIAKTQGVLDQGYKLLTGYETPEKGYEWFGKNPGHEALTAYGLMEFADMSKVYDVDRTMVERTAAWLMSRRDHKGGFARSQVAIDSFGRANETTTNAYIMWALSEAKRTTGLDAELAAQRKLAAETKDPYLLALATSTLVSAGDKTDAARRLAAMQAKDGGFPGAKETITMSGGESLGIETTALAVMALVKASPHNEYEAQIRSGVDWLNSHRSGYGEWANTQATILGLKALTAYSNHARQMQEPGSATLVVNGKALATIKFDKGRRDALTWTELPLVAGVNHVELQLDSSAALPYSIAIDDREARPQSSDHAKVTVRTELTSSHAKMGEGVTLRAHVENRTKDGIPMTLARIGIPGGMTFQTWQLKELRDKGLVDFYETRPREVIVYWRNMAPSATKDFELKLLASVPGDYEAPSSAAYLYYTAEDKTWAPPVAIKVD